MGPSFTVWVLKVGPNRIKVLETGSGDPGREDGVIVDQCLWSTPEWSVPTSVRAYYEVRDGPLQLQVRPEFLPER